MDEVRAERLRKKYASRQMMPGGKGGPRPGGRGRRGMPGGKPKNVRKTLGRLWKYISADMPKLMLVFFCVILSTLAMLAGSYMLRPVINGLVNGSGRCV